MERRYPVEIIISPTAVQGEGACREIAAAIRRLAGLVDVIIVARGGGSFEDLFEFNHPEVVKAIAASPVPVVSAIGHEVDVTLADLAADVRAPTPSAAAELVVPDRNVLSLRLQELRVRMNSVLLGRVAWAKEEICDLRDRLRPQRVLRRLDERKTATADLADRLERGISGRLERDRLLLAGLQAALAGRSPRAVLARGTVLQKRTAGSCGAPGALQRTTGLKLRFYDGSSEVNVERVDHDGNL